MKDGYHEYVITTNKPIMVQPEGDIIGAQLLRKHGRCIDADLLMKKILDEDDNLYDPILHMIHQADTILEATE